VNSTGRLDQLERSAYRSRIDHGVFDVVIGAFLVAIGLMLHADLDYMPVIVFFVGVVAFEQARRRLIEPRIGQVRLRAERRARLKAWRWLTLLVLVAAVFGVLAARGLGWIDYPDNARPLVVTGCFVLPLALAAWLFGIHRWFVYAATVFAGGVIEWRFGLAYGASWYFSGGLIVVAGLALMLRFVRKHPADDGDQDDA
jgi:magnesium-transporting ATPase (P-type)